MIAASVTTNESRELNSQILAVKVSLFREGVLPGWEKEETAKAMKDGLRRDGVRGKAPGAVIDWRLLLDGHITDDGEPRYFPAPYRPTTASLQQLHNSMDPRGSYFGKSRTGNTPANPFFLFTEPNRKVAHLSILRPTSIRAAWRYSAYPGMLEKQHKTREP